MSTQVTRFAFIDAVHAAEVLQVSQDTVLDWVKNGRLRSFGGKTGNPFLRSVDVAALASELGVTGDEPPKRTKSATAKVQQRLTADSRWSEVTDADIREWVERAEPARRTAALVAAKNAIERLELLLRVLDESENIP